MPSPVRVKICGITSLDDAKVAVDAGADAIGLVFYGPSPRNIPSLELARDIALSVPPFVSIVALVVNANAGEVERILNTVPVSLMQFHGDEDETYCSQFGRPYIKALRMKPDVQVEGVVAAYPSANGLLLDAYQAGVPGGTGERFDWSRIPSTLAKPIALAGGLTPFNVADAVAQVGPWAVDVSGGVEASPGLKSASLVRAFVQNAKNAAQTL